MLNPFHLIVSVSLVSLVVSGCRDTSTPSSTLVGHWLTTNYKNDEIHLCYSPNNESVYYNKTTDNLERLPYKVISESPEKRIITVEIGENGSTNIIGFSLDNKEASVIARPPSQFQVFKDAADDALLTMTGSRPREKTDTWKYLSSDPNSCR